MTFRIKGATRYVQVPNPKCSTPHTVWKDLSSDAQHILAATAHAYARDWQGSLFELAKTKAGQDFVNKNLEGDLRKFFDPIGGDASCRTMCLFAPEGAQITKHIEMVRDKEADPNVFYHAGTGKGFSQWYNVYAVKQDGRQGVCGTLQNWKYDHGNPELQDRVGMLKIYYKQ